MRHRLYYHIVWATHRRHPLIGLGIAEFLSRYLVAVCMRHGCVPLALGIVSTHVHLAVRANHLVVFPALLSSLKGASARVAKRERIEGAESLRWARGYSISTVGGKALPHVIAYVTDQGHRHPTEAIPGWRPPVLGYRLRSAPGRP